MTRRYTTFQQIVIGATQGTTLALVLLFVVIISGQHY